MIIRRRLPFMGRYPRLSSCLGKLAVALVYLAAYAFLAGLGLIDSAGTLNIAPWNPSVAAGMILFFIRGYAWSPLLFVAALSCQLLLAKPDLPLSVMLATSASEAVISTAAFWLLRDRFKIDRHLTNLRDVILFAGTMIAASGCMGVSTVMAYYAAGIVSAREIFPCMAQYGAGDCLGLLIVVPFFLINGQAVQRLSRHTRFSGEAVMQTAFTLLLVPFAVWMEKNDIHIFYTLFIPPVWAAISGGLPRVTWIVLAMQLAILTACRDFETAARVTLGFLPFMMSVIACMGLIIGCVVDERERVKLSNLKNDARLKAILDMAPDGMMIVDMQGNIVTANRNFMQIYGAETPAVVANRPVKNILPTFYTELNGETFLLRADGRDIPIEISSSKVPVGDKFSTILTIRDITGRKQAETQMRQRRAVTEQATRMNLTGGLAAVLAHELNQPLSAIMSYAGACANIVAGMDAPPPRVAEQLAKVAVQARRAGDIIRRLREFFQNSSIEVARVNVGSLIDEVVMLLEDDLTQAGVDVDVSIGEPLIAAIDRTQIEQVLINLIKNSIEALKDVPHDRKKIRLTGTLSARGDIEIVVADSGPGIAPEIADQLFSPFVTTRLSGMGLGLTISRSIVEAHNGRLWAELQSSVGASMHFTIPVFDRELRDAG